MVEPAALVKLIIFLGAYVPPHLDAFGLELSGVDNGPTRLNVELSGEFFTSFVVNRRPHFH